MSATCFAGLRMRRGRRRVAAALVAMLLLTTGCSAGETERYDYFRVTVAGQETLGVALKDTMVRGVIVYFHGSGTDEFAMTADEPRKKLVNALVTAGFAIVSSEAHGDAWGSNESLKAYLALAGTATDHYQTENVYFLAEDMGTLAAVKLMALGPTPRVRGLAAINPVLDLTGVSPEYQAAVASSYRDRPLESENPMALPRNTFAGRRMMFFVDPADSRAPAEANARAFGQRFAPPADLAIVDCSGESGCLQGDTLVKWFAKLEKRS